VFLAKNKLKELHSVALRSAGLHMNKSSQIYLYSAFHNTDCIKTASQYQSKTT